MAPMSRHVHRIRDALLASDAPRITQVMAATYTIVASVTERRLCRVSPRGGLWLHTWSEGAVFFDKPSVHPVEQVRILFPLFFYNFTPALGDVVIDIGAGVGSDTAEFSRLVGPAGRVISIEAHPRTAATCQQLVDHLGLENVRVINAAVTDRAVDVWITDEAASLGNHLSSSGLRVRGDRLGVLLNEVGVTRVDFAKVNIEGAERELLLGMDGSTVDVRQWCVSCHDFLTGEEFETIDFVAAWLRDSGYSVRRHPSVDSIPSAEFYVYGSRPVSAGVPSEGVGH